MYVFILDAIVPNPAQTNKDVGLIVSGALEPIGSFRLSWSKSINVSTSRWLELERGATKRNNTGQRRQPSDTSLRLTTNGVGLCSLSVADQLVLERRDPPADVHVLDGLDEQRPLLDAEAVHLSLSLVLFAQQQAQLSVTVQVDVGAEGFFGGFDADGELGGRRGHRVGSEVDDDGPRGVEPLQRALGATQVHLLHVPGVALMSQAAGGEDKRP